MQKDIGELVKELQEKLEWYTMYATDEEYDAKAVESILYLLDTLDPIQEDKIPDAKEAWQRFEALCEERELGEDVDTEVEPESQRGEKKSGRIIKIISRYRGIVAAVLLILVLAVVGGVRIEAVKDGGFFHWLKRDETGQQMVTNPESLNGDLYFKDVDCYYNREELPEWTKTWAAMTKLLEVPENFQWQRFEVKEMEHYKHVSSIYRDKNTAHELVVGQVIFTEQTAFITEIFSSYSFVDSYEEQKQIDIYTREEESGKIYYRLCYRGDNYMYYTEGEYLEELKMIMDCYLDIIK